MIADTVSGETQLVIEKTITERYPITDYKKVMKLYQNINAGGGRRCLSLKDFTKK
jgi:succinylarginine dihydrolase